MRIKEILELVKILESHDINEIEISRWGKKIRISKNNIKGSDNNQPHTTVEIQSKKNKPPIEKSVEDFDVELKHPVAEIRDDKKVEVRAPIVGTFYRAPAPDADPYVKVGDFVKVGQPLCIIEAMKIMNIIESEVSGRIVDILVENAQPVEYNQPLFIIEKAD